MSCYNIEMPISRTLNQEFFETWSAEMAYVLGFFAADGSMLRNSRGACFIEFTVVDRQILVLIKKVAGSSHRIAPRERGGNCQTAYRLQIGSKKWFESLTNHGFTQGKSKTLEFPFVPDEYFADFARGYFDGDGCVYFAERYAKERGRNIWIFTTSFTSGSRTFLESLHTHLKTRGVTGGSIKRKERGFELVFSRRDSLALYKLIYHTGSTAGFCLARKRRVFAKAIKTLYGVENVRS